MIRRWSHQSTKTRNDSASILGEREITHLGLHHLKKECSECSRKWDFTLIKKHTCGQKNYLFSRVVTLQDIFEIFIALIFYDKLARVFLTTHVRRLQSFNQVRCLMVFCTLKAIRNTRALSQCGLSFCSFRPWSGYISTLIFTLCLEKTRRWVNSRHLLNLRRVKVFSRNWTFYCFQLIEVEALFWVMCYKCIRIHITVMSLFGTFYKR